MKGNKFLAAVLAASMAFSAVPATTLSVFAATVDTTAATADNAATVSVALKTVADKFEKTAAADDTAAGTAVSGLKTTLERAVSALDDVSGNYTVTATADTTLPYSNGYDSTTNKYKYSVVVAAVSGKTDTAKIAGTYVVEGTVEVKQDELDAAVTKLVNGLEFSYDATKDEETNTTAAAKQVQDALNEDDTLNVVKVATKAKYDKPSFLNGAETKAKYTFTFTAVSASGNKYNGLTPANVPVDIESNADKVLDAAETIVKANDAYNGGADPTTSADEITAAIKTAFEDATDSEANTAKTDYTKIDVSTALDATNTDTTKLKGTITLKLGDATRTIKFTRTISKDAVANSIVNALKNTASDKTYYNALKKEIGNNLTTDDSSNLATGADKDALAKAVKKVADQYLSDKNIAGDPSAVVDVSVYEFDKTSGNGFARGTIAVNRNGVTGDAAVFGLNVAYNTTTNKFELASDADSSILQKADNQKLAEQVKALDDAVKKDADLKIKNTVNTRMAPTESQIIAGVKAKATPSVTDVTFKQETSASDDKKVDVGSVASDAVNVKSYTAPTSEADGTAVVTVTYSILKDGAPARSNKASDYVTSAHDITLTFKKLAARTTTKLSFDKEKVALYYGSKSGNADVKDDAGNSLPTQLDLLDVIKSNGNSKLVWTSSDDAVVTVDENGKITSAGIGEATITAAVEGNSDVKATIKVTVSTGSQFKDVQNAYAYYYDAVNYFTKRGYDGNYAPKGVKVVAGVSDDEFGVSAPVTRAQFVTFLYRAAGEPNIAATSKFSDVASDAYYAKAVAWAVKNNITAGKDDTHFAPNDTVTRAEAVTFLYRFEGEPNYTSSIDTKFDDVKEGSYYYDAVQWAAQNNVTAGKTNTTFAPKDNCNRAEGITFIYRTVTF